MVMFEYLQPVLLYKNKKLQSYSLAKLCECFCFLLHTSAASSSYFSAHFSKHNYVFKYLIATLYPFYIGYMQQTVQ